jgi:hypothetical protein
MRQAMRVANNTQHEEEKFTISISITRVFFARGISPLPKMVTNSSFATRNFMQPMGRPKHALKVPCFFFSF